VPNTSDSSECDFFITGFVFNYQETIFYLSVSVSIPLTESRLSHLRLKINLHISVTPLYTDEAKNKQDDWAEK
jgi:hypothetical protein